MTKASNGNVDRAGATSLWASALLLCVLTLFPACTTAQDLFRNPESVVVDYENNRYFVSNKATGEIVQIDEEGNQSYFNTDQTSIRGLHIVDDHLYAASDAGVAVVDLATGNTVTVIGIAGAIFLNDIASDASGHLYVTDSNAAKINKIQLSDYSYSTFVDSGISSPNGLLFDEANNRLLLCSFRQNSPIQAIDLADASVSTISATSLSNLDGLAEDNAGNIYVSSWSSNAVYRFDQTFENPPELVSDGHSGPADIFFNTQDDVLAVPNFNVDSVDFIPLAFGSIIHVPGDYGKIQEAIDAASYADTVLVSPGTYVENINFRGKNIVVASHYILNGDHDHISNTTIDGSNPSHQDTASCVVFCSGEKSSAVLQGFTINGGHGTVWVDPDLPQYTWRGGGGVFTFQSSPTIKNNLITLNEVTDNTGVHGAQGGGILCYGGNPQILNNLIMSNQADYGAGIVIDYSGGIIRNNIIHGNSGGQAYGGGGFWSIGNGPAPILIENNAIVENESVGSGTCGGRGGAMFVWMGTVTARNNIIWGNTQSQGGPIAEVDGGRAYVSYSDVEGGFSGEGNIDQDPDFTGTNYLLDPGSLCIDAGDTSSVLNDPENPENPGAAEWPAMGGLRSDMGAYGGPGSMVLTADSTSSGEEQDIGIPHNHSLGQNYPNPAHHRTTIEYAMPKAGKATLVLYDVSGKLVDTLVDTELSKGQYRVQWHPEDLSSGIYVYCLAVDGEIVDTNEMTLLR